ncbi:MAG: DUF4126 domain-containing protein, partial [Thermomicrobiales bacterium]|nr:DUF4126 domain-containing protein [Thermomicrobiales bacterium]
AGMFLMMAVVANQGEIHEVAAMFIGLLLAGAVHAWKSITRTRITIATNGLANPMVSFIEDGIAGVLTVLAIVAPWIGAFVAIPAGIGLAWVYRKTSGPNDLIKKPEAAEDGVRVLSETSASHGRRPKRPVTRRAKPSIHPETPDA